MTRNMGKADRLVRGAVGVGAAAGSGLVGFTTGWGVVLLAVAAVMGSTSASGYCPAYSLAGISTTGSVDHGASQDGSEHQTPHIERAV